MHGGQCRWPSAGCWPAVIDINKNLVVFLAERASFLAGGGDMVFAGSVAVLLRTGDRGFTTFESSPFGSALGGAAVEVFP